MSAWSDPAGGSASAAGPEDHKTLEDRRHTALLAMGAGKVLYGEAMGQAPVGKALSSGASAVYSAPGALAAGAQGLWKAGSGAPAYLANRALKSSNSVATGLGAGVSEFLDPGRGGTEAAASRYLSTEALRHGAPLPTLVVPTRLLMNGVSAVVDAPFAYVRGAKTQADETARLATLFAGALAAGTTAQIAVTETAKALGITAISGVAPVVGWSGVGVAVTATTDASVGWVAASSGAKFAAGEITKSWIRNEAGHIIGSHFTGHATGQILLSTEGAAATMTSTAGTTTAVAGVSAATVAAVVVGVAVIAVLAYYGAKTYYTHAAAGETGRLEPNRRAHRELLLQKEQTLTWSWFPPSTLGDPNWVAIEEATVAADMEPEKTGQYVDEYVNLAIDVERGRTWWQWLGFETDTTPAAKAAIRDRVLDSVYADGEARQAARRAAAQASAAAAQRSREPEHPIDFNQGLAIYSAMRAAGAIKEDGTLVWDPAGSGGKPPVDLIVEMARILREKPAADPVFTCLSILGQAPADVVAKARTTYATFSPFVSKTNVPVQTGTTPAATATHQALVTKYEQAKAEYEAAQKRINEIRKAMHLLEVEKALSAGAARFFTAAEVEVIALAGRVSTYEKGASFKTRREEILGALAEALAESSENPALVRSAIMTFKTRQLQLSTDVMAAAVGPLRSDAERNAVYTGVAAYLNIQSGLAQRIIAAVTNELKTLTERRNVEAAIATFINAQADITQRAAREVIQANPLAQAAIMAFMEQFERLNTPSANQLQAEASRLEYELANPGSVGLLTARGSAATRAEALQVAARPAEALKQVARSAEVLQVAVRPGELLKEVARPAELLKEVARPAEALKTALTLEEVFPGLRKTRPPPRNLWAARRVYFENQEDMLATAALDNLEREVQEMFAAVKATTEATKTADRAELNKYTTLLANLKAKPNKTQSTLDLIAQIEAKMREILERLNPRPPTVSMAAAAAASAAPAAVAPTLLRGRTLGTGAEVFLPRPGQVSSVPSSGTAAAATPIFQYAYSGARRGGGRRNNRTRRSSRRYRRSNRTRQSRR